MTAPTPNAQTSVSDVIEMATPACLIAWPICSGRGRVDFCWSLRLLRHCIITNMSSIPIPGMFERLIEIQEKVKDTSQLIL